LHQRRRFEIGLDARIEQDLLAALEETPEIRVRSRPRRTEHEADQPIGMLGGDHLPDGAAGGVADEVSRGDAERVHESQRVVGHLLDRVCDA